MTPEQTRATRIVGAITLASAVAGGLLGHGLATQHKLFGTIIGAILAPGILAPATAFVLIPEQLAQVTRKK